MSELMITDTYLQNGVYCLHIIMLVYYQYLMNVIVDILTNIMHFIRVYLFNNRKLKAR